MIKVLTHENWFELRMGSRITGPAYLYLWTVHSVDLARQTILIYKHDDSPLVGDCFHDYQPYGRGGKCIKCGMRRLPIEELLSKSEDQPRTVILNA